MSFSAELQCSGMLIYTIYFIIRKMATPCDVSKSPQGAAIAMIMSATSKRIYANELQLFRAACAFLSYMRAKLVSAVEMCPFPFFIHKFLSFYRESRSRMLSVAFVEKKEHKKNITFRASCLCNKLTRKKRKILEKKEKQNKNCHTNTFFFK